jgi:adenylate kinase
MRIVFLGPPGVGKGTQAKLISEKFGLAHISTGEMLRSAIAAGSEVGLKAKELMDRGRLVPDEVMLGIVRERVAAEDCRQGYILDGFPRTVAQGEALQKLLASQGSALTHVLVMEVTEDELRKRLEHRRGSEARADDSVEVQLERLRIYQEQTAPLIKFYEHTPLVRRVDACGKIEQVQQNIVRELER